MPLFVETLDYLFHTAGITPTKVGVSGLNTPRNAASRDCGDTLIVMTIAILGK